MRWDVRDWFVLLLFLGMYVIPATLMLYFVLRAFRRGPRAAKTLFKELGAQGAGSPTDFLWEGTFEGVPFAGRYFFSYPAGIPSLSLRVASYGWASFSILGKTKRTSFSLWLLGALPTGQPELDASVLLAGEDVEAAIKFFQAPEKRKLVLELIEAGVTSIDWEDGNVGVHWKGFSSRRREPVEYYRRILRKLGQLAQGVPAPAERVRQRNRNRLWLERLPTAFILASVPLAMLTPGFVLDSSALIRRSFLGSLPLLALYLVAAWQLGFRRRHFRQRLWTAALSAIIAIPVAGALGTRYFNNVFDSTSNRYHRARAIAKAPKPMRGGREESGCYVWVESWRLPGTREKLSIDASQCKQVDPGKTAFFIETRSGRLGFEWVVAAPLEQGLASKARSEQNPK